MELDFVIQALYTLSGLSALIVVLTQIFKDWWSKPNKRWLNHLLSFIASFLCNGAVLAIGIVWNIGLYAGFDVENVASWLTWFGSFVGCALIANGLWTYDFMKQILDWLKLLPTPTKQINEQIDGNQRITH